MKLSTVIARQLKSATFPESHVRELRAMFVAQVLAYEPPLSDVLSKAESGPDVWIDELAVGFRTTLGEINEFLPVDTKLAMALYQRILKARIALVGDSIDPALMRYALTSSTQDGLFSDEFQNIVRAIVDDRTFRTTMTALQSAVNNVE